MNLNQVKSIASDKLSSLDVNGKEVKKLVGVVNGKLPAKVLSKDDVRKEQLIVVGASVALVAFVAGMSFALLKKSSCNCKSDCSCGCKKGGKNINPYKHHDRKKCKH